MIANEKPTDWLKTLRNPDVPEFATKQVPTNKHPTFKEAHQELLSLKGVGPKVADCVCLMGLGWGESVPVDTHVWQIAQRDYKFGKKAKTFNKAMYDAVGDHFRDLWGKYAGWAHSVLFTADLREFANRTPGKIQPHAVQFKEEMKQEALERNDALPTRKRKAIVKMEEIDESIERPLLKKRRSVVKMEVKTEVKMEAMVKKEEEEQGGLMVERDTIVRRRSTRARQ